MSIYTVKDTSVVLLAAGRGSRMRSLTDKTPKPLLKVGDFTLIEHHLYHLRDQGFKRVVINVAYLSDQIRAYLGDGKKYNLTIDYSDESQTGALETAGGLKHALPLIQSDPFLVVNADIWTDFSFNELLTPLNKSGRVVLVDNPEHNPDGDFQLTQGKLSTTNNNSSIVDRVTFSGIALYKKSLFENLKPGKSALGPILRSLIDARDLEGVKYAGEWIDIGTPERLDELNQRFLNRQNKFV